MKTYLNMRVIALRAWMERRLVAHNIYAFVISMAIFSAFLEFFYVKDPLASIDSIFGFFCLWGFVAVWFFLFVLSSLRALLNYFGGSADE